LGKRQRATVIPPEPTTGHLPTNDLKEAIDKQNPRAAAVMSAEDHAEHSRLLADYSPTVEPDPEPVETNVFATGDNWDYEKEQAFRDAGATVYVIHKDEFYSEESGFAQISLTYYQGDDTLADDKDVTVPNYQAVVGEMKFGKGSADDHTFFVRNTKHSTEYEILLHEGSYAASILGLHAEEELSRDDLKHSQRRMRQE
jgi:hypothetical protein